MTTRFALGCALALTLTPAHAGGFDAVGSISGGGFQSQTRTSYGADGSFRSYTTFGEAPSSRPTIDSEGNFANTPDSWKRTIIVDGKPRRVAITPCGQVHVDFLDGRYLKGACK